MPILLTKCPRCGGPLDQKRPALNSLSRYDNKTYICTRCGTVEALWQYENRGETLPPLNEYIGAQWSNG